MKKCSTVSALNASGDTMPLMLMLMLVLQAAAPLDSGGTRDLCSAQNFSQAVYVVCLRREAAESEQALAAAITRTRQRLHSWDEDASYRAAAKTALAASGAPFVRYRLAQCAFAASLTGEGRAMLARLGDWRACTNSTCVARRCWTRWRQAAGQIGSGRDRLADADHLAARNDHRVAQLRYGEQLFRKGDGYADAAMGGIAPFHLRAVDRDAVVGQPQHVGHRRAVQVGNVVGVLLRDRKGAERRRLVVGAVRIAAAPISWPPRNTDRTCASRSTVITSGPADAAQIGREIGAELERTSDRRGAAFTTSGSGVGVGVGTGAAGLRAGTEAETRAGARATFTSYREHGRSHSDGEHGDREQAGQGREHRAPV